MPTDVVMPQMGESIFEGTITRWLKKAGETVQKDEPLFEISTDKVDAEIPSPVAGVLSEIRIAEGATVEVNTVVAVMMESGEGQGSGIVGHGSGTQELGTDSESEEPAGSDKVQRQGATSSAQVGTPVTGGTEVVMPQMGESIFEGTITKWLKKEGDTVQKDEPLFEISTDKVDAEIPSPAAGLLTEIKVPEGATVEIDTVVAVIGGRAAAAGSTAAAKAQDASHTPAQFAPASPAATVSLTGGRVRSSPLVRRIAKENNLDLSHIPGTGSEGRITKEDALRWLRDRGSGNAPAPNAPSPSPPPPPPDSTLPGTTVPLSRMRAIIADRMVESLRTSPHVYTVYKVDMTRIVRLRERQKERFEQQQGVKLTYMPFIAAAAVAALRQYPIVNATLTKPDGQAGSIQYHPSVNLGIAVALEWGLIVPVVKQAERRSFADLARTMADLALRARSKKLQPEEVAGSTFTLTNQGVFGGEFGTPIINQPESAILAIGGLKKEAVVLTDAEGNDTIAIRSMQNFCLGFDHRLIDGADGGRFMLQFKKVLEGWDQDIG